MLVCEGTTEYPFTYSLIGLLSALCRPGNATHMVAPEDTIRCTRSLGDELIWGFTVVRGGGGPLSRISGGHWLGKKAHLYVPLHGWNCCLTLNSSFLKSQVCHSWAKNGNSHKMHAFKSNRYYWLVVFILCGPATGPSWASEGVWFPLQVSLNPLRMRADPTPPRMSACSVPESHRSCGPPFLRQPLQAMWLVDIAPSPSSDLAGRDRLLPSSRPLCGGFGGFDQPP